jgi:CRP-like cAMP-binding protein
MILTAQSLPVGEMTQKIHQLFKEYPLRQIAKGAVVMSEDEPVEFFYFLEKGVIRMNSTSESGKVVSLHLLYAGSVFPLLSLANNDCNHYEFRALTNLDLRAIPKLVFKEKLMTDAEVTYYFLVRVAGGLIKISSRLENALATSALLQLASVLEYFVTHENSSEENLTLNVTHHELADWLGLTRENVSVQMRKLVKMGIVESHHGQLHILDRAALKKLAQIPSVADEL